MVNTASTLVQYIQTYGILDFFLPFILVFTIVYATLAKLKIVGEGKKQFNIIIALVLALLFVVPHMVGTYPLGYDPVVVLNTALPSISLVSVAAIMVLLLMGVFGTKFAQGAVPFIALVSLGFVVYIFGAALNLWTGPYDAFSWWSPQLTELLVVILVFGLIIWLIVKEPAGEGRGMMGALKKGGNLIKNMFEKV
ncbi:hypothetical protein J4210_06485 [Candidatus Woesearchaeota archaeon]|nr:hypothetical protein [Candidatus Woesearchaeota archaeon]